MDSIASLAREVFGIVATAVALDGERDRNVRLDVDGTPRYVLKVHAADTDELALELQDAVLRQLEAVPGLAAPRLVASKTVTIDGRLHRVRLLDWLDGTVWADAGPPSQARLRELGAAVARLDSALSTLEHPALDREYRWSMPQASGLLSRSARLLAQPLRGYAETTLARLREVALEALPQQAIHNDANEYNILVGDDGGIAGIIDVGDVVRSPRICGLAVALAYAALDQPDPLGAMLPVIAGYHAHWPLTPMELGLLPTLVDVRFAMSIVNAAEQRLADPGNVYLDTSQAQIREVVELLATQPYELREIRFRHACGYRPVARERQIVTWLQSAQADPAAILPPEQRTAVFAPFDGAVHSVEDGGIVLLEHRTGAGEPFWVLIGHLSEHSLTPGAAIQRGQRIGNAEENGQIRVELLTTLLGRSRELPAAARSGDVWRGISPDPNLILRMPVTISVTAPDRAAEEIIRLRRANLSGALSTSYTEPLHIVGGSGAHLIDAGGRHYIDLVNNVCHVGHAHPRVVRALADQAAVLNTNTRYLHPNIVEFAQRLTATLPDPLSVVMLTNSGSEANDLALRLARTATGREHTLVLDWAYHGNLTSLIEISPYKFNRRGGTGPGPRVRVCELPDAYRGRFGGDGARYATDVRSHCADLARAGTPAAVFLHESIPGCAGQVELAPGYLTAAYATARAAGALCVADEVQTGFGRVGSHMWAFEQHGVVPDIVTMGKPIGNGHPIGAVVTTPQVAHAFLTGMEYFNTYGGNPVSCAVGLAVLDVIRDERLMAHAALVGSELIAGLTELAQRHDAIGDIRGRGLFIGVDLVEDRATKAPAAHTAKRVIEAAKKAGVLLSSDGPHDNVLKIKPPLVLTHADAAHVLTVIDAALA